jgi:hypothetical protein
MSHRRKKRRDRLGSRPSQQVEARDKIIRMISGATPFQQAMLEVEFERRSKTPGPCSLCGVVTGNVGAFFYEPPVAQRLGAQPGKCRAFFHYLCDSCDALGGAERLERRLFEWYGQEWPA